MEDIQNAQGCQKERLAILRIPSLLRSLFRDLRALFCAKAFSSSFAAYPAKLGGNRVLGRLVASFLFNLPGRDPHDVDRVTDRVGGTLLSFGASGHGGIIHR